jgi:hypothetical protein
MGLKGVASGFLSISPFLDGTLHGLGIFLLNGLLAELLYSLMIHDDGLSSEEKFDR